MTSERVGSEVTAALRAPTPAGERAAGEVTKALRSPLPAHVRAAGQPVKLLRRQRPTSGMQRLPVWALDVGDGQVGQVPTILADGAGVAWVTPAVSSDPTDPTDPPESGTVLVPLTTTVGGEPCLVWDDDDNLVMTEVPR